MTLPGSRSIPPSLCSTESERKDSRRTSAAVKRVGVLERQLERCKVRLVKTVRITCTSIVTCIHAYFKYVPGFNLGLEACNFKALLIQIL